MAAPTRLRGRPKISKAFLQSQEKGIFGSKRKVPIRTVLREARKSGQLRLVDRALVEVPQSVCAPRDNLDADEKWYDCVDLRSVDVSHNAIVALPDAMGDVDTLETLVAAHNRLAELPASLGNLPRLVRIKVDHNQIQALDAKIFGAGPLAKSLVSLEIQHNRLTAIPDAICGAQRLQTLDVSHNAIAGLPEQIAERCPCLSILNAEFNRLRAVPIQIGRLKMLQVLQFAHNAITALPDLSSMQVRRVDVRDNKLSQVPKLPSTVEELHIDRNVIRSIAIVATLPRLRVLGASDNRIGVLPREIALSCTKLTFLDLKNNNLSAVPGEFGILEALQSIELEGNPLRGFKRSVLSQGAKAVKAYLASRVAAPPKPESPKTDAKGSKDWFEDAQRSGRAQLSSCGLHALPKPLYTLATLTNLDASRNRISEIATSPGFTAKTRLIHVDLSHNKLDLIPAALLALSALRNLVLSHNRIRAVPELKALAQLEVLCVDNNSVADLAAGLGAMQNLHTLALENNALTRLPLDIGLSSTLKMLTVTGNPLRRLRPGVIARGTPAILNFLRMRIPEGSPLLAAMRAP